VSTKADAAAAITILHLMGVLLPACKAVGNVCLSAAKLPMVPFNKYVLRL
jgi:hypothetical protein